MVLSDLTIFLAAPRGFCAGVVRAIDIVELTLEKYGSPVYVKHQIVHNPVVVSEVEAKGAITVEKVSEVPENSVVVFSAHGSPPSDYKLAKEKKLGLRDITTYTNFNEKVLFPCSPHSVLLVPFHLPDRSSSP